MSQRPKDAWDKAAVVLQPVGGLLTAISVALLGFLGSRLLSSQQAASLDTRLYTELMSNREQADSALRKDMFGSIIDTFLKGRSMGLEQDVLNLELLAYNFHESLDLGPLFKHVLRKIDRGEVPEAEAPDLLDRLERVAKEVTGKQVGVLEEAGAARVEHVDLEELAEHPEGVQLVDERLDLPQMPRGAHDGFRRRFIVEVLDLNEARKELRIRLRVWPAGGSAGEPEVDATFWLGFFDFPMIDNTRLSHGQRCAVVLSKLGAASAQITVLYFPGSRASLKEKPFYDEVLQELLRGREVTGAGALPGRHPGAEDGGRGAGPGERRAA